MAKCFVSIDPKPQQEKNHSNNRSATNAALCRPYAIIAAMRAYETWPPRAGLGALLVLSIFAWAPALYPGYWQGLEGFVPLFNAAAPGPVAAVATTPDLWRGTGSAAFLLAQPLITLGISAAAALRLTFIFAFLAGGFGIYAWLQPRLGDAGAGLAGLAYALAPLFLSTVYIRGSVADALVLALVPVALAGLTAFAARRSLAGAAVAVLAIFWLWRTQAGLAGLATLLLLVYVLAVERSWRGALVAGVAAAAGLVTLLPFWNQAAPAPVIFTDHFLDLYQLFAVGWAVAPSVPGWQDRLPLQLGFVLAGFGVLALWGWAVAPRRTLPAELTHLLWFALAGALTCILLATALSAPLWQLTAADRLLTYPWQMLLLALPLLAALAGALPVVLPDLRTPATWTVLVALTVLASYAYLTTEFTTATPPDRPLATFGRNQIALLDAQVTTQPDPAAAHLAVTWQPLAPLDFDYSVFFQAVTGEGADAQMVAQLDVQPLAGARPATSWRPGEILTETYTLDLRNAPADAPLRYYFGYYDWRDGRRLPVDGGLDDKLVLDGE